MWITNAKLLRQLDTNQKEILTQMAKIDDAITGLKAEVAAVASSAANEIKAVKAAILAALAQGGVSDTTVTAITDATAALAKTAQDLDTEAASLSPAP
jgi:hypothetical protein